MRLSRYILIFGVLLLIFSSSGLLFKHNQENEVILTINGKKVSAFFEHEDQLLRIILQAHEPGVTINSMGFLQSFVQSYSVKNIQVTITNSDDLVIEGLITDPLIIIDSQNVTLQNVLIQDLTVNNTVNTVITLENCPNSLINNCFIQNIGTSTSSVAGINITDSSDTSVINSTIDGLHSTYSGFLTAYHAFGLILEASNNIIIQNVTLNNITSTAASYGIYGVNAQSLAINASNVANVTSRSSWGIFLDNCDFFTISDTNITSLSSSTSESSAISANNCTSLVTSNIIIDSISGSSKLTGIKVAHSPLVSIIDNQLSNLISPSFFDDVNAISLDNCPSGNISLNSISNVESVYSNTTGISISNSDNSEIRNNTISEISSFYEAAHGIQVKTSTSTDLIGNILIDISSLSENSLSSNLGGSGAEVTEIKDISGFGIVLLDSSDSRLEANSIIDTSVWAFIDESSPGITYLNNRINGQLLGLKSFIRPSDLAVVEGKSETIEWSILDSFPSNYTIYRNNQIYSNTSTWDEIYQFFNLVVEISTTNLSIGEYEYFIVFTETSGRNITDTVVITIIGNQTPIFVIEPEENFYYQYGSPKSHTLSWLISDDDPSSYTVYQNGTPIAKGEWNASALINVNVGGQYLGVYNYTLIAHDTTGNAITDLVYVWVLEATAISVTCNTEDYIEFEVDTLGHILNWTVLSVEPGTYNIYRDSLKVTTGTFYPGVPVDYPVDNLGIGTYLFTFEAIDPYENTVKNSVTVRVITRAVTGAINTTQIPWTAPPYTPPTYTPAAPEEDYLWLGLILALGGICGIGALSYFGTKRLMLPEPIKEHKRALKEARKANDKAEEARQLGEIGRCYLNKKDYKNAIKHNLAALEIYKITGNKKGQKRELASLEEAFTAKEAAKITKEQKEIKKEITTEDVEDKGDNPEEKEEN